MSNDQTFGVFVEAVMGVLKSLLLVNGGALVAILTLMGTGHAPIALLQSIYVPAGFFVLGCIFSLAASTAVSIAISAARHQRDAVTDKYGKIALILQWASLLGFVCGALASTWLMA